jgi:hypothetical protein
MFVSFFQVQWDGARDSVDRMSDRGIGKADGLAAKDRRRSEEPVINRVAVRRHTTEPTSKESESGAVVGAAGQDGTYDDGVVARFGRLMNLAFQVGERAWDNRNGVVAVLKVKAGEVVLPALGKTHRDRLLAGSEDIDHEAAAGEDGICTAGTLVEADQEHRRLEGH